MAIDHTRTSLNRKLHLMCVTPCLHFVGFRDDAYTRAVKVFGRPHFVHRYWDRHALADVAPDDTVIFANSEDWLRFTQNQPRQFAWNDSEYF